MIKKPVVVWDLDGTLACGKHRLHLLPTKDKHITTSWDAFNLACVNDAPINDNLKLMEVLHRNYYTVILTGRSAVAEKQTRRWLQQQRAVFSELIMRPADDHRKDIEFKEDMLRKIGLERIQCCFDDLEHVAKHIRSLGVTCHLVTHYDTPHTHELPRCEHRWVYENVYEHELRTRVRRAYCSECGETK